MGDANRLVRLGLVLAVVLALVGVTACDQKYLAQYTFSGSCEQLGREGTSVSATTEAGTGSISCKQADLRFSWRITDYGVQLEIDNQSRAPVEVQWAKAAYLDEEGRPHDLIATEGPIGENAVETSFVAAGQNVAIDWLFPKSYSDQYNNRWMTSRTLFDPPGFRVGKTPEEIEAIAAPVVGKSIGWRLPVHVDGIAQTITFSFVVNGVQGKQRWLS